MRKCVTKICCYRHKGVRGKKDELHPLVCVTKMQINYANNTKLHVHKGSPREGVLLMGQLKSKTTTFGSDAESDTRKKQMLK